MSLIDEIKQRVDIVEVVSEHVSLQKSGRNFKALCPFHTEKHPSFFVFPEQQRWHCFGSCGTGGDVFTFLMRKDGLDFGEVVQLLAERTHVPLTPRHRDEVEEREREKLYHMNGMATEYYHHLLLDSPAAEGARDYLAGRGISHQSIIDFRLGFSLDSWQALQKHLMEIGYEEKELIAGGLAVEREEGGSHDRFRKRLMFPISDPQGRVLGFGARALDTSLPKYLNSPQTIVFDKSSILYGIDRAKAAIRKQGLAVIAEGYTDAITAHQHGFTNVVASMGTALSEKQVDILKPLTKTFLIALDADAAGNEATLRELDSVWHASEAKRAGGYRSAQAEVRVIRMPVGKDPDDTIRGDPEEWQRLVDKALPWADFILDNILSHLDLTKPRDKSTAVEKFGPYIAAMPDPIQQSHYLQKLARLVKVDERTLEASIKGPRPSRRKGKTHEKGQEPSISPLPFTSPVEEYCLALLLQHPELKETSQGLLPDYFEESENRQIFIAWQQVTELPSLKDSLDPSLQGHLESLLAKELPPLSHPEDGLSDCILRMREKLLRGLKVKEEALILEEGRGVDAAELARLQEQAIELNTRLREVFIERSDRRRVAPKE